MSEFIGFLEPPGDALKGYNSRELHSAQSDDIPQVFREAMSVREEVFVDEQNVPLENEYDYDDARSYHWVAYASVGTMSPTEEAPPRPQDRRKSSTANKVAVGTLRLVPPPHPPHPEPGSSHKIDNAEQEVQHGVTEAKAADHTPKNGGQEPYIKLGRLAVLKAYRGLGLANLLMNAALQWAAQHPEIITPPLSPTAAEHRKLEMGAAAEDDGYWKGLVLVHAQASVQKIYKRYGFTKDESMGEWDEEGISHIGMWKRLDMKQRV